jgi:hypothetical protein
MYRIVVFAVSTFGSRSIGTPFDTASIPVYVPPPSVNARKSVRRSGIHPVVAIAADDCSWRCRTSPGI